MRSRSSSHGSDADIIDDNSAATHRLFVSADTHTPVMHAGSSRGAVGRIISKCGRGAYMYAARNKLVTVLFLIITALSCVIIAQNAIYYTAYANTVEMVVVATHLPTPEPTAAPTVPPYIDYEHGMPQHCVGNDTYAGVAVMFEPRENGNIPKVLQTAIDNLPADWLIQMRGSDNNANQLAPFIDNVRNVQNITESRIRFDFILPTSFQLRDYNAVQADHGFYSDWRDKCIPRVLLFQSDSVFCESPAHPIDQFYQFAFIGGVWTYQTHPWLGENWCGKPGATSPLCGFNTGFAMFDTLVMYDFTSEAGRTNWLGGKDALTEGELGQVDAWLGHQLNYWRSPTGLQARLPSEQVAKYFAVEFHWERGYAPVGVHKPWAVGRREWESELKVSCPNYGLIMPELPAQ